MTEEMANEMTEEPAEEEAVAWYDSGVVWYGSLRGGIEFSGGETNFYDGGSRWGIKGSAEASEGLTAVYRFEHKFSTSDASQAAGRLGYVGLSGGFGSLTLGQIWSASYNHAGVIRDFPNWHTSPDTSARVGNAVSYAMATDVFSMQIDAIMNGKSDTGKAVDQLEFGMTFNLGGVGKVALAHTNVKDTMTTMAGFYSAGETEVQRIMVTYAADDTTNITDGELNTAGLDAIRFADGKYRVDTDADTCGAEADGSDACMTTTAFVSTEVTRAPGDNSDTVTHETFHLSADVTHTPESTVLDAQGHKASHISAEFGLGAITAALGYSEKKKNGASGATKTSFVGVKGSLGDSGLSWGAYSRTIKGANGTKSKPWTIGLSQALGGGAWTYVEHGNDGNDGSTVVALGVNF